MAVHVRLTLLMSMQMGILCSNACLMARSVFIWGREGGR